MPSPLRSAARRLRGSAPAEKRLTVAKPRQSGPPRLVKTLINPFFYSPIGAKYRDGVAGAIPVEIAHDQ